MADSKEAQFQKNSFSAKPRQGWLTDQTKECADEI